ncbi:hypothetical protein J7E79_02665 [Bacillus sp. ISL-40]|uniref:hypothetical protein n=1 Tax=unclassified Bacillus (in: firmicutes) TaxID=185979 RepID=UPI001BE5264E|nr:MULTISPECIES: hypothetical protein [unclassified Bacillus (in: firmicutes)]MBT2696338.1 hypothetical protein [Bacillus sp. ISL-40]MBT2743187.1 hypothetical protein [Bacillus sp. ISL-77]
MSTWEDDLYTNVLWLDISDPAGSVLKKFNAALNEWVPTSGAYSTAETDTKLAALEERLAALENA